MEGITYLENFVEKSDILFEHLRDAVKWDESMAARKTASFGKAYNYSQISYPYQPFIPELIEILDKLETTLDFRPNNCLLNFYLDGKSKMGFHSDQTDILAPNTGVAIVSLGEARILRFRKIADKEEKIDFELPSGSLLYMNQELQNIWQHAIPKTDTEKGRMSLTFRTMKL